MRNLEEDDDEHIERVTFLEWKFDFKLRNQLDFLILLLLIRAKMISLKLKINHNSE